MIDISRILKLGFWVVWGLAFLLLAACSPERPDHPLQEVLDLPPEVADHLVQDSEAEFAAFGRESGNLILRNSISILNQFRREALDLGITEFTRRDSLVDPYFQRLARCLGKEYGLLDYQLMAEGWQPLSPARKMELERINELAKATVRDQSRSLADREMILQGIVDLVGDSQPGVSLAILGDHLADLAIAGGREGEHRYYLDFAIAQARREQKFLILSQLLGELGMVHQWAGRPDSMLICYDEALAIAMDHRLPEMAGRMHEFYAHLFIRQGRPGLAKNSFDRAIEVCRAFKGGYWELRFLLAVTEFHAGMGCWDLVEHHLDRAEVLERQFAHCPVPSRSQKTSLKLDRMRARWLMATGQTAAGDRRYAELAARDWSPQDRSERVRLLKCWGEDLVRGGRCRDAAQVLADGIRLCMAGNMPEEEPPFWVLLARANQACGDWSACRDALSSFRDLAEASPFSLQPEWLMHDLLTIEADLADGSVESTVATIRTALQRLREYQASLDSSSESHLVLGQANQLRHLLLQIARPDPEVGFSVEMLWRQSVADHGAVELGKGHPLDLCAELLASYLLTGEEPEVLPDPVQEHLGLLHGMNAVHICFLADTERITRWTADADGIECRILEPSAEAIAALVERTRHQISTDPGDFNAPISTGLQEQLKNLGEILLPSRFPLATDGPENDPPLVLVTASGCLANFPFGALAVSGKIYRPLLADYDLAYLQAPLVLPDDQASAPGLVVADPILSPEISRWVGPLAELTFGQEEALLMRELIPTARLIRREGATKEALLAHWSQAPFLYFAVHTLRDPEEPYLSFIPLSVDRPGLPLEAGILDAADILAARFDGCGLVVLSGCASGKAFQGEHAAVPSLGAAFSSAGAGCVVQTFWDVRDEDAGKLMDPFLRVWAGRQADPVRALAGAQRRFLSLGSDAYRHPFSWGAYSALIRTAGAQEP